jgi:hypothetical protein
MSLSWRYCSTILIALGLISCGTRRVRVMSPEYLGLRDFVFCDDPWLGLRDAEPRSLPSDPQLAKAIAALRAGQFTQARKQLESLHPAGGNDPTFLFALARAKQKTDDSAVAIQDLRTMLNVDESRGRLFAWSGLRELGYRPTPAESQNVLGVVVEIGFAEGVATVSGYADGDARLLFSRGAVCSATCRLIRKPKLLLRH